MNTRDFLFILLRFVIKGEPISKDIFESLNSERLAALFKIAKLHDVAHLVAYALEKNGFYLDDIAWQECVKEKELAVLRYEMMRADLDEIASCLEAAEIDYIPLKGAVIRSLYPEPWMRTSCDIDILVRESDIDRAIDVLVSRLSYKTDFKKTGHEVSLFSPFGMHLELHYSISSGIEAYDSLLLRAWDYASCEGDSHCYKLTDEFCVFYYTAHIGYHLSGGGCGIKSIIDLWLVEQSTELDKILLGEFLEKTGLQKLHQEMLTLGQYWMGEIACISELERRTEVFVLLGGSYGTTSSKVAVNRVKKGGGIRYFLSRIFMPYEKLSMLYPIVKKHKILVPFCQVARWLGAISKKRRLSNEMKIAAGMSKEQEQRINEILNFLEI